MVSNESACAPAQHEVVKLQPYLAVGDSGLYKGADMLERLLGYSLGGTDIFKLRFGLGAAQLLYRFVRLLGEAFAIERGAEGVELTHAEP